MQTRIELPQVNDGVLAELAQQHPIPTLRARAGHGSAERLGIQGQLQLVLKRQDGSGLYLAQPNLVTNAGFDLLCDVLGLDSQPSDLTHIAIGTGTTAASATQTALVTQNARVSATYAHTAGTKVMTLNATVAAGTGTGSITEAGCFNASTGGTMFNRVVFSAVSKGASDALAVTFTFTLA